MEQLNKVQLRGIIGSVKTFNVGDRKCAKITIATNLAYRGQDGCCIIETQWHNITVWEGNNIHDVDQLKKGDAVEVIGRLKNQRYTSADGTEHSIVEILAHTVSVITGPMKMEE